jgi:hypothetical protein
MGVSDEYLAMIERDPAAHLTPKVIFRWIWFCGKIPHRISWSDRNEVESDLLGNDLVPPLPDEM